jgi:hypothetical protein
MLIRAAELALERARLRQPGWLYDELATMTFAALAIEALCNSVGAQVVPDWTPDFESASPNAKLRVIAENLGIAYAKDKEPWSGARELVKFRNRVAHAHPQLVVEDREVTQQEFDSQLLEAPKSNLEKMISAQSAERALRTVESIRELLLAKLTREQREGISRDQWTDSATVEL